MALRLCKIEITLSLQSISKEVHGRAARRVKTYGIPVKLRILPPGVRSENGPFRPDTGGLFLLKGKKRRIITSDRPPSVWENALWVII